MIWWRSTLEENEAFQFISVFIINSGTHKLIKPFFIIRHYAMKRKEIFFFLFYFISTGSFFCQITLLFSFLFCIGFSFVLCRRYVILFYVLSLRALTLRILFPFIQERFALDQPLFQGLFSALFSHKFKKIWKQGCAGNCLIDSL